MSIRGEQENSSGLFRIGQVSRLTDTKPFVLRYWETEFPMLQPVKSPKGHRLYRKEDVDTVLQIKRLLYDEGFTIAGARRHLREGNGALPEAAAEPSDRRPEEESPAELAAAEPSREPAHAAHFDAGPAISRKVLLDLRDSLRAFLTLLESE